MKKLAIIGAGSMAEALISGMIKKDFMDRKSIWVTNRSNEDRLNTLKRNYGVNSTYDLEKMLKEVDIVILAMKPKDVGNSLKKINNFIPPNAIIVSLLAGVSTKTIEILMERPIGVVRAMPNTSAAIGQSATAIAMNKHISNKQLQTVKSMFDTVGLTVFVEEEQLDAVTGLSGSGPAYIYYLIEAMEKSAAEIGLHRDIAKKLIVQTLIGAAGMVSISKKPPEQLRREVTSPNGTTEAGIKILGKYQVEEAFIECIKAATERSKEIGSTLEEELVIKK